MLCSRVKKKKIKMYKYSNRCYLCKKKEKKRKKVNRYLESIERIRVWQNSTALLKRGNDNLVDQSSHVAMGAEAETLVIKVLVDDADHAVAAVLTDELGAVEPDGAVVLDDELEHVVALAVRDGKVEAGEEAGLAVRVGQRLARLREGRLSHRVVHPQEVPLHHVAHLGHDVVRVELEPGSPRHDAVRHACQVVRASRHVGAAVCC